MNTWIVGDLIGAVVLVPALGITLGRLLLTLRSIARGLDVIVDSNSEVLGHLHAIPRLAETELLTGAGLPGVTRYTSTLEQAL